MSFRQRYNGRHNVMLKYVLTTSGLSVLLHGVYHSQMLRHVKNKYIYFIKLMKSKAMFIYMAK